jgi:hypothetical protein
MLMGACVEWATDFELNFLDILAYKMNQFGAITDLQEQVTRLKRNDRVQVTNYYQDLRRCVLFVTG